MNIYYIDKKIVDGAHLIHSFSCPRMSLVDSKIYLGILSNFNELLDRAYENVSELTFCPDCCSEYLKNFEEMKSKIS